MVEFIDIAKEYGLGAAIGAILIPWIYSVDRRSRKSEENLKNVHDSCHIPENSINELKKEVSDLKDGENDLKTRFAVVESKLDEISTDMKAVLNHLIIKGIDK